MNKLRIHLKRDDFKGDELITTYNTYECDMTDIVTNGLYRYIEEWWDVIKIEQSTGIYDKNGTMIFDGDRVRISRYDGAMQEEDIVQWKDGAWFIERGVFCGSQSLGSYKPECLEVVG